MLLKNNVLDIKVNDYTRSAIAQGGPNMNALPIGTIGVTVNELKNMAGTIKKGTKVEITGVSNSGYEIIAENGFRMIEVGFANIIEDKN